MRLPQLIQHHEIRLDQCLRDFRSLAYDFFLFQHIDQFNSREEASALPPKLSLLAA